MPGERLVAVTHIHRMVVLIPLSVAAFGLGLVLAMLVIGQNDAGKTCGIIGAPLAFIPGLFALNLWLERWATEFSCTDRRILIKSGWLTTRLREMSLAKVEALHMRQGLVGKVFGFGTLVFKGSGGTRRTCGNIEEPFGFYRSVQEQMAAQQRR